MALAAGARQHGVRILENTTVTGVTRHDGRVTGVTTEYGGIEAEYAVAAACMWGREFGALAGVGHPRSRRSRTTTSSPSRSPACLPGLPTIKSAPDFAYVKNEGAGVMVGFFEPGSYPGASRRISPPTRSSPACPRTRGPPLAHEPTTKRRPARASTAIRLHFGGSLSYTPDGLYYLGEAPGLRTGFIAAGFNSVGFLSCPWAGSVLADWIVEWRPPIDLPETDPRRAALHETNRRFLERRVTETLDLAYQIHWPDQKRRSIRGLRRSPLHDRVTAAGAVFGQAAGLGASQRARTPGVKREYEYSFGLPKRSSTRRPSTGPSARPWACSTPPGSASSWCRAGPLSAARRSGSARATWRPSRAASSTPSGSTPGPGIEADVTVTRLAETRPVPSGPATLACDRDWLERHIGPD